MKLYMAENKDSNEKPKKSLPIKAIIQSVMIALNLGVIGFGLFLTYQSTLGWQPVTLTEQQLLDERKKKEELAKAKTGELDSEQALGPLIYTLDKFTVNLAGEPKRSIRIEVNLEMLSKDGFEEVIHSDNRAKARDQIVRILNDKSFSEIETIQGKLFLKDRIAMELNGLLNEGVVKDVYFSEFVVQ